MEKLDLSKKRPFNSITEVPILATSEEKIKEAMMQYHQDTFLPNLNALIDNCRKFYHNTIHELYYNQLKVDMMDSRLKTLEARFGNKSLLIKGLPAHGHNRTELERNVWHYFQKSGVSWECLAAMSTHTLKRTAPSCAWNLPLRLWAMNFSSTWGILRMLGSYMERIRKGKGEEWYSDQRQIVAAAVLRFARFVPGHTTGRHERKQRRAPVRQGDSANTAGQKCKYSTTVSAGNIPTGQQVPETLSMRPVHCGELPWRDPAEIVWRLHHQIQTFGAYSSTLKICCCQDYDSKAQFWQGLWHLQHSISASAVSISDDFRQHDSITGKALEWSSITTNFKERPDPSDYGKDGKSKGKLNNKGSWKSTGKGKLSNKGTKRFHSLHNVPVRIGIQVAMPRLQRKSYSPRIFQQCRALKHQTAIVTPFWAWGNVCFAKRTAPSGGMREMCINNIIRHLLSSVGTCSWTSASITSILQSTKIFFNM